MENYYKAKWTSGWYIPNIRFLFLRGDMADLTDEH